MLPETIFRLHLILGYIAWLACFATYLLPWLKSMPRIEAHRLIATLHSFRFFGLVFILPGVVAPDLPVGFATFAAYGDFATGLLALAAVLTMRWRSVFWLFTIAFNIVGVIDLIGDYIHATLLDLPSIAGSLGATYPIPVLYVPLLMITHVTALYWLLRPQSHPMISSPAA